MWWKIHIVCSRHQEATPKKLISHQAHQMSIHEPHSAGRRYLRKTSGLMELMVCATTADSSSFLYSPRALIRSIHSSSGHNCVLLSGSFSYVLAAEVLMFLFRLQESLKSGNGGARNSHHWFLDAISGIIVTRFALARQWSPHIIAERRVWENSFGAKRQLQVRKKRHRKVSTNLLWGGCYAIQNCRNCSRNGSGSHLMFLVGRGYLPDGKGPFSSPANAAGIPRLIWVGITTILWRVNTFWFQCIWEHHWQSFPFGRKTETVVVFFIFGKATSPRTKSIWAVLLINDLWDRTCAFSQTKLRIAVQWVSRQAISHDGVSERSQDARSWVAAWGIETRDETLLANCYILLRCWNLWVRMLIGFLNCVNHG